RHDEMRYESSAIAGLIPDTVGRRRGHDVLPARARKRFTGNDPASKVARYVVEDGGGLSFADGLQVIALAMRTDPLLVGHLLANMLGEESLFRDGGFTPLAAGLCLLFLRAKIYGARRDRRRHLLALRTEQLLFQKLEVGLELFDLALQMDGVVTPAA